jgi:hypothetical protein
MDLQFDLSLEGSRGTAVWMLGSFLVVFVVTRVVTRMIHAGRGPFGDTSVGGVHVHHLVYGIFLMLLAGAGEFAYQPGGWWQTVLAVAFGAGAALTLDEFALWLRLSDVYWEEEGRVSVDAVLVVAVVGGLLVLGANPFDPDPEDSAPLVALSVVIGLAFAVLAAVKGKVLMAIIGLVVPIVAVVGAIRLAKPHSPWARRRYRPGSSRDIRSRARYPEGRRTRWDAFADAIGGGVRPRDPVDR